MSAKGSKKKEASSGGQSGFSPMSGLEETIGYRFRNIKLLETALTHSSYINEVPGKKTVECYERLEFLGDSVLGMLTADMLFASFKKMPEGELSMRRSKLVCEASLSVAAKTIELGSYLRLGKGEELTGGRTRASILADVVEAVVAALYLDGGIDAARRFVAAHVYSVAARLNAADNKTELQEKVQASSNLPIKYVLAGESGPDHEKRFTVEVWLGEHRMGEGTGTSKKEAEQHAAGQALKNF